MARHVSAQHHQCNLEGDFLIIFIRSLGKRSNLTTVIFFNWAETTKQIAVENVAVAYHIRKVTSFLRKFGWQACCQSGNGAKESQPTGFGKGSLHILILGHHSQFSLPIFAMILRNSSCFSTIWNNDARNLMTYSQWWIQSVSLW